MSTYRALARTYRSRHFGELVGQDVLVRTLTHAIEKGRLHHAYMFTGIRGTGKTSTARILARAINYVGPNGDGKPTAGPTDDCPVCQAIGEDRHPDVIEIDAASNTGVDDVRQIIENVRYAPVSARYKVFIIDEVHMLSKAAFNALLKTLEEPPPHVVFMFATTEIRKVPVTILSRCQRFDLRRIETPVLLAHYKKIAEAEKLNVEDDALYLIARAADGSARDGLSLLDQAIAQAGSEKITAEMIRAMLGRGDAQSMAALFEAMMQGEAGAMLKLAGELHQNGAEPATLLDDLLDFVHFVTRVKVAPKLADEPDLSAGVREAAKKAAEAFPLSTLSRVWQMLLKAVQEVAFAPQPQQAFEMALIRVAFASTMPPLEDLLKNPPQGEVTSSAIPVKNNFQTAPQNAPVARVAAVSSQPVSVPQGMAETAPVELAKGEAIADFAALVALCDERDPALGADLYANVNLVKFQQGRIEFVVGRGAAKSLVPDLQKRLNEWTGQRWIVTVASSGGQPSLSAQDAQKKKDAIKAAYDDPAVKAFTNAFPSAKIIDFKKD